MISNTLQKRLMAVLQEKIDLENQLEAEQECIVNKLSKEISKLRKEKEALVVEVEREEERLTNALQIKLERERREKEELEKRLQIEQREVCFVCVCLFVYAWCYIYRLIVTRACAHIHTYTYIPISTYTGARAEEDVGGGRTFDPAAQRSHLSHHQQRQASPIQTRRARLDLPGEWGCVCVCVYMCV